MPVAPRVALNRTANATASAANTLKQMQQTLQGIATSMQGMAKGHAALASSVEKAAKGHTSLNNAVSKSSEQAQGNLKSFNGLLGNTGGILGSVWKKANLFWRELTSTGPINELRGELSKLAQDREYLTNLEKSAHKSMAADQVEERKNWALSIEQKTRVTQSHLRLAEAVHKLGQEQHDLIEIVEAGAELYLVRELLVLNKNYAEYLQQANSSLETRNALLNIGLSAQMATGQSVKEIGPVMKEMVALGQENNRNFRNNVVTGVMLERSLGVSAANSARLAQQAESTHTSFQKMGNVLSEVAQTTALTADEAARFATEIGKALQTFAGNEGQSRFPQIAREVLLFAGSLKEVGGNAEDVLKLFQGIQSGKNLTAAALLGVSSFSMDSTRSVKQLENGLANLSRQMDNGSLSARVTMSTYAELMGVEESTIRLAGEAIRKRQEQEAKYGALMGDNELLQKSYNAQMSELGEVLPMLRNMFMGLVYSGLTPLVRILQQASRWILGVAQSLAASRQFLQVVQILGALFTVVLVVGIVRATFALVRFAAALSQVVIAASQRIKEKDGEKYGPPPPPTLLSKGTAGVGSSLASVGRGVAGLGMLAAGAVATYDSINTLNDTVAKVTSEYKKHGMSVGLFGMALGRATELIGGVALLFYGLKNIVTGVIGVFQLLYFGVMALVGVITGVLGLFTPVGWVIIGALVAAGVALYLFRDQVINAVRGIGKWVANFLGFADVQSLWNSFTEHFFSIFGAKNWDDFKKDWYNHLMWGAGAIVGTLIRWGTELYAYLTSGNVLGDLGKLGTFIWTTVKGWMGLGDVDIEGWIKGKWNDFTGMLSNMADSLKPIGQIASILLGIRDKLDLSAVNIGNVASALQKLLNLIPTMPHIGVPDWFPKVPTLDDFKPKFDWLHMPDFHFPEFHLPRFGMTDTNADIDTSSPQPFSPLEVRRVAYQPMPVTPLSRDDTDSPALRTLNALLETNQLMHETAVASNKLLDQMNNARTNVDNTFSGALTLQGMTSLPAPVRANALA